MRISALFILLLLLAAQQCLAIRDFGGGKELYRPVRRWGRSGKTEEKTFTLEQMGRVAFDPEFAKQHGDIDKAHLGYDETAPSEEEDTDVKQRLREMFPLLDLNKDGYIDAEELWHWHAENGINASNRRHEREFNTTDTNKDGFVSLAEYLADLSDDNEDLSMENITDIADFEDWLGTIKTAFKLADRDGDGQLNVQEYFEFQNPEESDNESLKVHVIRQDIHLRDDDHDGFLNFDEFFQGHWSSFQLWENNLEDDWDDAKDREEARQKFVQLDANGDENLDTGELRAAFSDLHPNEKRYARLQSEYMMEVADANHDNKLTLQEALENAHAFYAVTEDEPDYISYSDEL